MSNTSEPEYLGYPHLEKVIESDNFDDLNKTFIESYEKLEKISQSKGDVARKKAAKKAMRSLEITMDLLREFLKVKDELLRQQREGR